MAAVRGVAEAVEEAADLEVLAEDRLAEAARVGAGENCAGRSNG